MKLPDIPPIILLPALVCIVVGLPMAILGDREEKKTPRGSAERVFWLLFQMAGGALMGLSLLILGLHFFL